MKSDAFDTAARPRTARATSFDWFIGPWRCRAALALAWGCTDADSFEQPTIGVARSYHPLPPPDIGNPENPSIPVRDGGLTASGIDGAETGESDLSSRMTAAHNAVRRAVLDTNTPLPDLDWSETLADYAREWADTLAGRCGVLEHRQPNTYGENLALRGSSRLTTPFTPEDSVEGWAAERSCWGFGAIQDGESCDSQCVQNLNASGCGHYTQIVWRSTARFGCGYASCQGGEYTYEVWVCNYDPPGNIVGRDPY